MRIASGVTDQYIYFVAVDATDLVSRETGLSSFTVYRSRNGGAATAFTTPTINETSSANMPGVYELLLDEDMTIDSGDVEQEVCLHITHAGMAPVTRTYTLFRPVVTAGETLTVGSGIASADIVEWLGTAPATPTVAGVPEVDLTHMEGSTSAVARMQSYFSQMFRLTSGHTWSTTTMANAGLTQADADHWKGSVLYIVAGTYAGLSRLITAFDASTDTITFAPALPGTPNAADDILIIPGWAVNVQQWLGTTVTGDGDWSELQTDVDAILVDTGTTLDGKLDTIDSNVDSILVDTGTTLPGTLTTIEGKIDTIDTNVDAILVDTDTTIPGLIDALPTAAENADAVWDEATTGHVTAGTFGEQVKTDIDAILVDTGTTLDGKIDTIDTNVDAILVDTGTDIPASIATIDGNVDAILVDTGTTLPGTLTTIEGKIDTVDTVADAIKLKTDNLPSDPADASVIAGRFDTLDSSLATVDTVVDAIKVTTDKLDDTLEDQGAGVYGFTAAALQEAPTGSGGGLDAAGVRAAIGMASANLDTQLDGINTNINANETKIDTIDTVVDAIKVKTDSLAFTSGNVNANIEAVNGTTVTGSGTEGDPWGP